MAGTMTCTLDARTGSGVRVLTVAWTSDASGNATGTTPVLIGRLVKAITVPSVSAAPTDNYDIAMTDEQGVDVLAGVQSTLANRDTANTEQVYFLVLDAALTPLAQSVHPLVANALTISVTNAGNAKSGTIYLYLEA